MGQQESKQGEQITNSLNRIRKDVRNHKITANDVERIQKILKEYSRQIEGNRNLRASRAYSIQDLIDITSKELDGLKQEVNLDFAAVSTNSFSRASSKNYSKMKQKSIKSITDAVLNIRKEIRTQQLQKADYEKLQSELVAYSQLLSMKKGKRTENEAAQKLISSVTEEVLMKQSELNSLRRSTNSLKRSSITERRSSWKQETRKEPPKITSQNSTSTLDDIDNKLEALKSDMKVAETNKDKSRLHFLSKSIQILMTDLQLVNVGNNLVNEERKELLERSLQKTHQQIDKIKKQLTEESDLKYLKELENKERKERASQDLDDIYNGIVSISRNLNQENFQTQKESFLAYKTKLEPIENLNEEIRARKSEVLELLLELEKILTKLEMEEKLNQAEWRHFQYKIDLNQFTGTTESDVYQQHRQYLLQLKEYVNKIAEINYKVDEKKKYVLYNIENNITALDHKARENENKLKTPSEEVVMRKSLKSNETLGKELVEASKKLPTTPDQIQEILPLLNEARTVIEQKLSLLRQEVQSEAQLVVVHEGKIEKMSPVHAHIQKQVILPEKPVVRTITPPVRVQRDSLEDPPTRIEVDHKIPDQEPSVTTPVPVTRTQIQSKNHHQQSGSISSLGSLEKYNIDDYLKEFESSRIQSQTEDHNQNEKPLLRQRPKVPSKPNSNSVKNEENSIPSQIHNIQQEVKTLQIYIENSRYSKDGQAFKDIRHRLENYKTQIHNLCRENPESGDNLLKDIDNVLVLLESHASNRKSTTEDILNDIMSVGTSIEDLGKKINNHRLEDYDFIKSSLLEQKRYLESLHIAPTRNNILKYRYDLLQQIDQHLFNLEQVKKMDHNLGSEEEKQFNQDLRKLKDKVNRYSGTYKNVLYKTIENDLDKHLDKAEKVFKDSNVALQIKEDIVKTKMILEQKSTKEQQFNVKRDVRESGRKELTEIRQNVESVKRSLSQLAPLTKEELDKLDARLTLSILALDNIKDTSEEKERLYQEIHLYFQKIQELLVMTASNSVPVEFPQSSFDNRSIIAATLAKIERELAEIKPEILSFVGTETSSNFLALDEILVRGTLKLDEMHLDRTSEWFQLKLKLMEEIHKYSDILDERIQQTEDIERLEKQIKVMLIKIDSFNGYLNDPEYTLLDEELINLKISLGKLQVNPELHGRKQTCVKDVDGCLRKLKEAARPKRDFSGTLV